VQIDVTRDANPDNQRSVIAYHYQSQSWIDIDAGNLWGYWPNDPKTPGIVDYIWPRICVANNNNILMGSRGYSSDTFCLILSTDMGNTWAIMAEIDSCYFYFIRSSHNPGSPKVVFTWIRSEDVWYMYSTDYGVTWSEPVNITNYQLYPLDSVRAYCDVNAVFDVDDSIHIAWTGRKLDTTYHCASKVFHWDEVNDTITIVNNNSESPGGWWTWPWPQGYGAWRLPSDEPQLITGTETGYLYCLWHGQTDTTDTSAAGWPNGDPLFGAYSTDNGVMWSQWVNLTNTHSSGAPAGECEDEDYMTANPFIVNDSVFITFIEDKDAGSYGGTITVNPVYCWVFHKSLVEYGLEEKSSLKPEYNMPMLEVSPNPFSKKTDIRYQIADNSYGYARMVIYDATGRFVKDFSLPTAYSLVPTSMSWDGTDNFGYEIPVGVYFIQLNAGNHFVSEKIIKCK
jgi:hypothetical protein